MQPTNVGALPNPYAAQIAPLRILTVAMMIAPVILAVALFFVLGPGAATNGYPDPFEIQPLAAAGLVVAAVALHLVCETLYRKVPALPATTPTEEATAQAVAINNQQTFQRLPFAEVVLFLGIAAGFVLGHDHGGYLLVLIGLVLAEVLLYVHTFPWRRPVSKVQARLESESARTRLSEALGLDSWTGVVSGELYDA